MNAQKYFEQHAEELIARYTGKNVALFSGALSLPMSAGWRSARMPSCPPTRC